MHTEVCLNFHVDLPPKVAFCDQANGASCWSTLNKLLDRLLSVTHSQYGFIGKKVLTKTGAINLQIEAVTNIAWSPALDKVRWSLANVNVVSWWFRRVFCFPRITEASTLNLSLQKNMC